jgi:Kef-type K+ transport system membrane component KefB
MARFLTLVAFIGVARVIGLLLDPQTGPGAETFFLGFLLLASYLAGGAARSIALPQITGYLVIGMIVGPSALGILTTEMVVEFEFVNEVALALIALSAGGELRISSLRERMRSVGVITALQVVLMFTLVAASVLMARDAIDFLQGKSPQVVLAVALLFGLVAVAKSPATTIAVITEERARGIFTDTVLGITVFKDVVILILIALLLPLAAVLVDPTDPFSFQDVREKLLEILGSGAVGVALGWLMTHYLRRVRAYLILFVLGVAFLAVYLAQALHLESILVALAAGFYVQNFSRQGRLLIRALEANALPIYAIFFAVAGAGLDFRVLRTTWFLATAMILARLVALWISTHLGARLVKDPPVIRRFAWMGFVAQAGVTLGIATRIENEFLEWGGSVATIIVAMIAVNQLIGPPAFRWAIVKAGESRTHPPKKVLRDPSHSPLGPAPLTPPA